MLEQADSAMLSGQVDFNDDVAESYNKDYGNPVNVSILKKATKWPLLQKLGFNSMMDDLSSTYKGVKDWFHQMDIYSSQSSITRTCWQAIKLLAPKNPELEALMTIDPNLGKVGLLVMTVPNMGEIFGVNVDQLKASPEMVNQAIDSLRNV